MKSFRSPITGEEIHSRAQYRDHLTEHGKVVASDFGPNDGADYFARQRAKREEYLTGGPSLQKEVRSDVEKAVEMVSQGYKPKIEAVEGAL